MYKALLILVAYSSAIAGCGVTGLEAARAACPYATVADFNNIVELARLSRDSGNSAEDWNAVIGGLCLEFAVNFSNFSDCSRCVRAVGAYVWQ